MNGILRLSAFHYFCMDRVLVSMNHVLVSMNYFLFHESCSAFINLLSISTRVPGVERFAVVLLPVESPPSNCTSIEIGKS